MQKHILFIAHRIEESMKVSNALKKGGARDLQNSKTDEKYLDSYNR
jgi:hypothetical protein